MNIEWHNIGSGRSKSYICGYCGFEIASDKNFHGNSHVGGSRQALHWIYICHKCAKPTYFDESQKQYPGRAAGNQVSDVDDPSVLSLYEEARYCSSANAYTASALCCRKLLMNIAVSKGASEGISFVEYVNFLEAKGYFPPGGREWVDHIRKMGNEATHEIKLTPKDVAEELIAFVEMLLKFIYEYPAKMRSKIKP